MTTISSMDSASSAFDPTSDNDGQIVSNDAYEDNGLSNRDIANNIVNQIGGGKAYGFNLSDVVEAMVDGEMGDEIPDLQRQITNTNVRISAVSQLENLMEQLQKTTLTPLGTGLSPYTVQSSDPSDINVISQSASNTPFVQPFTVNVTTLAKTDSWVFSNAQPTASSPLTGSGKLSIQLGSGAATEIDIAANSSLTTIATQINSANAGVAASVVQQNDGKYHLVVTSNASGANNKISFSMSDTSGDQLDKLFNTNDPTQEVQKACDADYSINGIEMKSDSNNISYNGVSILLNKEGASATINTQTNTSAVSQSVGTFVTNYNALIDAMNKLMSSDTGKQYQGSMYDDSDMSGIMDQLSKTMMNSLSNGSALMNLGISFNQDGSLELNQSQLEMSLTKNPMIADQVLSTNMTASDASIQVIDYNKTSSPIMSATQSGTYDVNISQNATAADFQSQNTMALTGDNVTISNDVVLDMSVFGETNPGKFDAQKQSDDIAIHIPAGTYTQAQLAQKIQSTINNNSTVAKNNGTVSVEIANGHLKITSNNVGTLTGFSINSSTSSNVDQLGISASDMTTYTGKNTEGTINGQWCLSDGQYLEAQTDSSAGANATGLIIKATGSTTGDLGTVTLSIGYSDQLNTLLDNLTMSSDINPKLDGVLGKKLSDYQKSLNPKELDSLIGQLKQAQAKKADLQERYFNQYQNVNSELEKMTSLKSYIDTMFNSKSNS